MNLKPALLFQALSLRRVMFVTLLSALKLQPYMEVFLFSFFPFVFKNMFDAAKI